VVKLSDLADAPRLLLEADLRPVQTERFQPTGFPDLGPATYTLADGTEMLLVESNQSMANRMESACWDETTDSLAKPLDGIPYVHVSIEQGGTVIATTASVLEAHRLNSPYVLEGTLADGKAFGTVFVDAAGMQAGLPLDRKRAVEAIFRFDPFALLHGLFMSNVGDGRMRLARVLSSFVEARNVRVAQSGGVKNDRVNPSGDTSKGFGNVPFARTEFTAERIAAFFNLDLRQLRGLGLPEEAQELLLLLAVYKFRRVAADGLRLRTACDLECVGVTATAPAGFELPTLPEIEAALPAAIAACRPLFAEPRVTEVTFKVSAASSKGSKKARESEE